MSRAGVAEGLLKAYLKIIELNKDIEKLEYQKKCQQRKIDYILSWLPEEEIRESD